MIYHRRRNCINGISGSLHSPAKVNFFLVGKEIFIKTIYFVKNLSPYKKRCTGGPKYLGNGIILAGIIFTCVKNATTGERVSKFIKKPSTCPFIFKFPVFIIRKNLWLASSNLLIAFHKGDYRLYPVFGN